jgi:hypothetical protein
MRATPTSEPPLVYSNNRFPRGDFESLNCRLDEYALASGISVGPLRRKHILELH